MASQKIDDFRQNRKDLKVRILKFIQNVNATDKVINKQQKQKLANAETDLNLILQQFHSFLAQFGYVFFLNMFMPQPRNPKQQIPVINKIIYMGHQLVKNGSKVLAQKYEELLAICELIQSYSMELYNFLNQIRGQSKNQDEKNTQANLMKKVLGVKKMITISKYAPKGTKNINDTERSTTFIEFSRQLMILLAQVAPTSSTKKDVFIECSRIILKIWPQTFLQERVLNHSKQIVETLIKQSIEKEADHCCSIFMGANSIFLKQETKFHEHKNYHWPIEMASIIKHVKKTIVGFLNLEGGIIYVGMKQNHDDVQAVGIYLTSDEVVSFFQWVHMLCDSIYPLLSEDKVLDFKEKYRENLESLKNRTKLQSNSQYIVNKYVAVEYLSIIDKETYEDCYEEKNDGQTKRLYLIRIKIKAGPKFDTFHLLKEEKQGEIECFKRNDASVNKLNLEEFFKLYNERLYDYLNEDVEEPVKCSDCPIVHFNFNQQKA